MNIFHCRQKVTLCIKSPLKCIMIFVWPGNDANSEMANVSRNVYENVLSPAVGPRDMTSSGGITQNQSAAASASSADYVNI